MTPVHVVSSQYELFVHQPQQLGQRRHRGGDAVALEARDSGLRRPCPGGELTLRQPVTAACLAQELAGSHGSQDIRYDIDQISPAEIVASFELGPRGGYGGSIVDEGSEIVWITTRRIKPDSYEAFRNAWRPKEFPEGMIRAYECYASDRDEVVGISIWDSLASREAYRLSKVEEERRRAMAPFVESETSGVYSGRELRIPSDAG